MKPILVLPPRHCVTQVDLENLYRLRQVIDKNEQAYNRIAAGVLVSIAHGAEVEPGLLDAEVQESIDGGRRVEVLRLC